METTKTALETALEQVQKLEERIAALNIRGAALDGEISTQREYLGKARIAGTSTAGIHITIGKLNQEHSEIESELHALQPLLEGSKKALSQAQANDAADQYNRLADGVSPKVVSIFQGLDKIHIQLCELHALQDQLSDLANVAGNLVVAPDGATMLTPKVELHVQNAIQEIVSANIYPYGSDHLEQLDETKRPDRTLEFAGLIPIERKG